MTLLSNSPINLLLKLQTLSACSLFMFCLCQQLAAETFFVEKFEDLSQWRPITFDKIEKHSEYRVVPDPDGGTMLSMESNASASALVHKSEFSVAEYPILRWRWKVNNILEKSDPKTKSGDDYPARVYVLFKYDADKASFLEGIKYASLKKINGEYPPHSSLNFVWSSVPATVDAYESPYTSRVRLIALRGSADSLGSWQNEQVNILHSYQEAFGESPPTLASIAVMSDSDNTAESTSAAIKLIELGKTNKITADIQKQ